MRKSFLSAVGLVLVFGTASASCGGDDEPTDSLAKVETSADMSDKEPGDELTAADLVLEEEPSGAPVTTTGRSRGGTNIYSGGLGKLELDELVTPSIVDPPETFDDRHPLTGLGGTPKDRAAAIVKIANGPKAIPQTGLDIADIIFEEPVEGGITRFAAVFQSQGGVIGPIRSGRTTDISIMHSFGSPLYLYSGANAVTDSLIRRYPNAQNRSADTSSGYYRESSRRSPNNIYTDLLRHWASGDKKSPPAQFEFRGASENAAGDSATEISINYRSNSVAWAWDGDSYLRSQKGGPHKTPDGDQLTSKNVIVIETVESPTGMVDSSGSTVPEYQFVGQGNAIVFTDGKAIEAIWTKPTLGSVATFTTAKDEVVELTPGNTWIQLIAKGSSAAEYN